jgi:cytoskeletal protein CcmA (bactofilin family)
MWNRDERQGNAPSVTSTEAPPSAGAPAVRPMACIGKSVVVKGDVSSSEDLAIDGRVEGRIELRGHCLTVGVGAAVTADVIARVVTIRGAITGNVTASEKIHIRETGSVDGNISAPRFAMVDGAVLRGSVDMTNAPARVESDEEAQLYPVAV